MPKDFFSLRHVRSLLALSPEAKIHVIGVSGVAMAQLAVTLAERGFQVSGSDKEFYEPMGSYLRSSPVRLCEGYDAANVPADADLVIIGNAISYGHPEVAVVEERNLPYTLFPQVLSELLIKGKHSIVVCGTHGKTTTTSLVASTLRKLGEDSSYFIGGASLDLPKSMHDGQGRHCVVEGDEYDSAFFAKVPKFDFYAPDTCIINAVEYDHADIYPDLDAVNQVFTAMVRRLKPGATVIASVDGDNLRSLVAGWKNATQATLITFGEHPESNYRIIERVQSGMTQEVTVQTPSEELLRFTLPLVGVFNAKNALAAYIALSINGFSSSEIVKALSSFRAVKRRQEVRFDQRGVTVVEDFAHHPTAIFETISAIREAYPGRRLWAIFEPRSNTSRKKIFFDEYLRSFASADETVLARPLLKGTEDASDLLDVEDLVRAMSGKGIHAITLSGADEIAQHLAAQRKEGDVFLVMSNGSFGGLIDKLIALFAV